MSLFSALKNMNKGPDFLCVGPHKTGTTWLYAKLQRHPEIWLSPHKELSVLDLLDLSYADRLKNLWRGVDRQGNMRRNFVRDFKRIVRSRKFFDHRTYARLRWWLFYFFLPYSFVTYPWLFPSGTPATTGDITPNYYALDPSIIRRLQQKYPDLKIILIVRNPVERAWSYLRMIAPERFQKPIEAVEDTVLIKCTNEIYRGWKPYPERIELWQRYFPNTLVTYFDELQDDPTDFHDQICHFLGVGTFTAAQNIDQKTNVGRSAAIPTAVRQHLVSQYIDEVKALHQSQNNPYVEKWLNEMM